MTIIELKSRDGIVKNIKLHKSYLQLGTLLSELRQRSLPEGLVGDINAQIEKLNAVTDSKSELKKSIRNAQNTIIKELEKALKVVPKNYYRNVWLALGMASIGVPLGVSIGLSTGNIGMLAVGIPIGMAIGMVVGIKMDKKASEEGRQLDFDLQY